MNAGSMKGVERQLSSALHTFAEGTTVTTADVEMLRAGIYERVASQNRRRSRMRWLVAAAATVAVVAGGQLAVHKLAGLPSVPAPPAKNPTGAASKTLPLTIDNLAGIWRVDDGSGLLWRFSRHGEVALRNEGRLGVDQPLFAATYRIIGTTVRFVSLKDVPCSDWAMTIQIRIDGTMTETFTEAAAGCPLQAGVRLDLTRLAPASASGVAIRGIPEAGVAEAPAARPKSLLDLNGIWLVEGSGRLVRLTAGGGSALRGTYAVDDDGDLDTAPDDVGTVSLATDGTITFTTSSGSAGCPPGSQFALHTMSLSIDLLTGSLSGQPCRQRGDLRGGWVGVSLPAQAQ